jgi:SAM-dependent methyltransferase
VGDERPGETPPVDPLSEARLFMRSRVILAAAELDLFSALDGRPAAAGALAALLGSDERGTTRLLDCLVGLGLVEKSGGTYRLTDSGKPLSSHHSRTILPMLRHLHHLWDNWTHLGESVRHGVNPHRSPAARRTGERLRSFIGAMEVVGRETSERIARSYDARGSRRLLDIGGGSGIYTAAFLRANPELSATLLDLPEVVPLAEERLRGAKLLDRVDLVCGDFYVDELPRGCDLALLSAIIHQNSPARNIELFRKVRRALQPGGLLLIRDHIMAEGRIRPVPGALFALNMLVCTDGGDTYTYAEIESALLEAGFRSARLVRQGEAMDALVEAAA